MGTQQGQLYQEANILYINKQPQSPGQVCHTSICLACEYTDVCSQDVDAAQILI